MQDFHIRPKFCYSFRSTPLRWRLTAWYVLLLAAILVGFSGFIYLNMSQNLRRGLDAALLSQGEQLLSSLDNENGRPRLEPNLPLLPGSYFGLYDAAGTVQETNMPHDLATALNKALHATSFTATQPVTVLVQGSPWRVLPIPLGKQGQQSDWILVIRSMDEIKEPLDHLVLLLLIAIPSTLLMAVGGGIFLARRALQPIDRIAAKARQISATDLSRRLDLPHSNDEVGHLVTTLDDMLDRLDQAFQRQRRFTADASHEFRTPLAIIRSQTETALQREHSPEEYRRALEVIRDQAMWMGSLTAKLLLLARNDDNSGPMQMETLDLADLVEGVADEFEGEAAAKGLRIKKIIEEHVIVLGDQTHLTQLLTNLVDNAIKYTPDGEVVIRLERRGRQALLQIQDTGVGIPKEHLAHIFERFYRVDQARSRAAGGAGLGLAICEGIVRSHGGKIEVESSVGQGTTFKIWLPAS